MYHDFLRFVCSHPLLYKAVLAYLQVDEERSRHMLVADKAKRLDMLSALLQLIRSEAVE